MYMQDPGIRRREGVTKDKDGLTKMQRAFINAYDGNQSEAARIAGYKQFYEVGCRLMKNPKIKKAIKEKEHRMLGVNKGTSGLLTDKLTRIKFWQDMMLDPKVSETNRLRASELLARACGDFIIEQSNADKQTTIVINQQALGNIDPAKLATTHDVKIIDCLAESDNLESNTQKALE